MRYILTSILFFVIASVNNLTGQPAVAPKQKEKIAIIGGTIHQGNGKTIENGVLIFNDGIIEYVGTDISKSAQIKATYDATKKHIYPGLIALCSEIGLNEIEQVKATRDQREIGKWNPNVRTLTSYNTDSKIIPTLRSNGVLLAQVTPQGGIVSGQSSVFQLDAWNWEDAAIKTDVAIHLHWPQTMIDFQQDEHQKSEKKTKKYEAERSEIIHYFTEARTYAAREDIKEKHQAYEAMKGLWSGQKKLFIHTNQAKGIVQAIQFAKEMAVSYVLVVNEEVRYVLDYVKEAKCPLVISQIHQLPRYDDDPIRIVDELPVLLENAGISFAIRMNGFWEFRNLVFQAGQSVAFGNAYERSLASITLEPAKILGIEKRCGSIEEGKDATFFISEGDALDMKSHKVTKAFIQGREIDLDNKQKELYRRFWSKYHPGEVPKY